MMALQTFIDSIKHSWPLTEIRYLHPSLYLVVVDDKFAELEEHARLSLFYTATGIDEEEASRMYAANNVVVSLVTSSQRVTDLEFLSDSSTGHHWIEFLANGSGNKISAVNTFPRIIHFYGYKGGQGRSTILTMLSKSLADDGYSVLAIDADIEAPSLPAQFGARVDVLESTLLGCMQGGLSPSPQQVYVAKSSGHVDMLSCKPSGATYTLDLAMFALNIALNPKAFEEGFRAILSTVEQYDVVLVDHRSGIASSAIALIAAFPGPAVICVRLDEQSDEADAYLDVLLMQNPELPGLFVSFSLDPEDTAEKLRNRSGARIDAMLDLLGKSISLQAEQFGDEEYELRSEALQEYWISWFHDRSFLAKPLPNVSDISSVNRQALMRVRELTGLALNFLERRVTGDTKALTNSGNTDEGVLIQTDALRRLRAASSGLRYVFGRKGTGKTRLVRALIEEGYGEPLLVADDVKREESISSSNTTFIDLCEMLFQQTASDKIWWVLLDSVYSTEMPPIDALNRWFEVVRKEGSSAVVTSAITERIRQWENHRVLLIDGVETAFSPLQMPSFVQGLFRFLAVIQANAQLASKTTIRLFLRTDLVQLAGENLEQQIEGRNLFLSWDTQSILNFALSRVADLPWFGEYFPGAVELIQMQEEKLSQGALSVENCEEILLEIFPTKVRRHNLLTLTFLKTYFSEGEGEAASFYPRIYDAFLKGIDDPSRLASRVAQADRLEDGRVAQDLIIAAHDYASGEYLRQVATELRNLISLSADDNNRSIDVLLASFRELTTPFEVVPLLQTVHGKLQGDDVLVPRDRLKSALDQMKRVGIFEDRPGWPGWWRAGRLFKNALGMKYLR